jgi:microcystin degradation protein MlrC
MGRRSKADLLDLVDRILVLYTRDKLTINQIAEQLQSEGIDISREAVRRSLKSSKEIAADLQKTTEEARVMIDVVRNNPNTDIAEAVTTRFAGLLLRESQNIDALEFEDPGEAILAAGRLANAQARLASVRLKYQAGFDAAKKAVLDALKIELAADPDLANRLAAVVTGLEPEVK